MKKALARYLFPMCVLLLGGFINLYADSFENIDTGIASYGIGHQSLDHASVHALQIGIEKSLFVEVTELEEQEERDENTASDSTDERFGSYFTAFFYASISEQLYRELDINLGFTAPSTITAPFKRHIRFQVFLI